MQNESSKLEMGEVFQLNWGTHLENNNRMNSSETKVFVNTFFQKNSRTSSMLCYLLLING